MSALASSVSAVIVFQRGAQVTRVARAPARGGEAALEGLPLCLDDESVRVELGADAVEAGWSISEVRVEVDAPEPAPVTAPDDDAAMAEAQDARDRAQARLEQTLASIDALRSVPLCPRASEDNDRRPAHDPTAGRLEWLALRSGTLAELQATLAPQRVAVDEASEALQGLTDARRAASSARDPRAFEPRKRIALTLSEGTALDEISIALRYRVPGARWAPSYTLRIEDDAQAQLELRAVVAQRTGEDWSGAALTVSTASWQAWHDLPRLDALRVGRSQPPVARAGWRDPPPDPEALYADRDQAVASLPSPSSVSSAMAASGAAPRARAAPKAKKTAPPRPPSMPMAVPQDAGGAPMPPPPPAAAPSMLGATRSRKAFGASRSEPSNGGADLELQAIADVPESASVSPSEPEAQAGLSRAWLDYGRLRLPMPWEAGRGRLRRVSVVASAGAEDRVAQLVSLATERAGGFSCSPPPGHAWMRARDGHAFAYVCDAAVSIPSDGQTHVVSVLADSLVTTRNHVCVPGISPDVFRTLVARSTMKVPLPAGPVDVYERDNFLLTGSLDAMGAGARFEVGLGVEQAIKVARNVSFAEDSQGLIKKQNAYTHRISIDVQNLLSRPASIELRERVPVPASDEPDIEVSEDSVEPPWDHYKPKDDALQGGRRWCIEVPAGAKASVRAAWTVRVPGGSELVGGNRRDA